MNDSTNNYDILHEIAELHYKRAEDHIVEYIHNEKISSIVPDSPNSPPVRLLDIGSGEKSTLLKALEKFSQRNRDKTELNAEIYLLDIKSFEGKIRGLQNEPYSITRQLGKHSYRGANFKAKFIKVDFNREIGTEKREAGTNFEYKSEITGRFDVVVLNFVIHEILDSSGLEIINSNGEKESLTTRIFLKMLFERIHQLLSDGAMVYFGDAYFPKYVNSQQTRDILMYLDETFGHADSPALFLHPEDIISTIMLDLKGKFELVLDTERLTKICKEPCLYRKSFFIGLKKL